MKFVVSVTETLNRLVCVEADSRDEAMEKAFEAWHEGIIVLDSSDHTDDVDINIYDDDQESIGTGYSCKTTYDDTDKEKHL